ncbi:hypothetical protein GUJ93_ZPchr0012g20123 [Zizania palustris]|uniref:Transposase (putative) gypsy type domain-containing protein n=1 Tax=Zizania palustris TaxID=103762 RepID=A0A8J6BWU6_ZIZPA|nr:hypothetical protein GUJ93_ZPchr0012g20123 [Zizania palustris]
MSSSLFDLLVPQKISRHCNCMVSYHKARQLFNLKPLVGTSNVSMAVSSSQRSVNRAKEFQPLTVGEEVVLMMESRKEIPLMILSSWRAADDELFPSPDTHEIVVFDSFFSRGFGLLTHPFLHSVLRHYDILLCSRNPNSILHPAIFVHVSEAFLGIEPHFNLFCHSFYLRSLGNKVVSGCRLRIHDGKVIEYFFVLLPSSNKGWNSGWFYVANHEPSNSSEIDRVPKTMLTWTDWFHVEAEVDELMVLIHWL